MSLHHFQKAFDTCDHVHKYRRPKSQSQFIKCISQIECHVCHPEYLKRCCFGCLLPYSVVGHHARGMCLPCFQGQRRYKKPNLGKVESNA